MNMAVSVDSFVPSREVAATIARVGDALLWSWGEAKRTGQLEAVVSASLAAVNEDGTKRAPGTYSNPTCARILAAEARELSDAMTVDREMRHWARDKFTRLWVQVAKEYYAGPRARTNAHVARILNVSERTVEGCRSQMRRYLVMAIRRP